MTTALNDALMSMSFLKCWRPWLVKKWKNYFLSPTSVTNIEIENYEHKSNHQKRLILISKIVHLRSTSRVSMTGASQTALATIFVKISHDTIHFIGPILRKLDRLE